VFSLRLPGQTQGNRRITGVLRDTAAHEPVTQVTVVLQKPGSDAAVASAVTDNAGRFILAGVPPGEYLLRYGAAAGPNVTPPVAVKVGDWPVDLGNVDIGETALTLDRVVVSSRQLEFENTIDRKIYSVGKEIQATTGSASDLLQNLPSVQVDIDGNVSLRGSDNVQILIDGRTSTLMGRSQADALQQIPADAIERIEVITNPSAKYKPDGTAGLINIVLKKKHDSGITGTVTASVGNDSRYNSGISANYNPGRYNIYGSINVRQDYRPRRASDFRTITDPVTGAATTLQKTTVEHSRPFSHFARGGIDYNLTGHDKLGASVNFYERNFDRHATDHNRVWDDGGGLVGDYDRTRADPEFLREQDYAATYQHQFPVAGHELNLELNSSATKEQEDNHYADIFQQPVQPTTYDNTLIRSADKGTEAIVQYACPLTENSKLEAGYTRSTERLDANFAATALNPATGLFENDPAQSNRFQHEQTIHAFYTTYAVTLGRFGVQAGLRPEQAHTRSLLVNTGQAIPNDYFRIYPSLHLAYRLTDTQELQFNFSERVHRPDTDDLNPFPEYNDPFTLRAGNPYLKPEDIHSFEAGYQYKNDRTTIIATVYQRDLDHGITTVTRDLGNSVLLTTYENLAANRSTGLELAATTEVGKWLTLNFSSNTFFNTIDASNLGFAGTKSDTSWSAKLGASLHLAKNTLMQFNTNYTSTRLTPQGSRRPTFVANYGLRQEFRQKKLALVLTVSDVFNSLKDATRLDTPLLKEEITRRRSARIIYLGLIYNFGTQAKKPKDDSLKFDNQI